MIKERNYQSTELLPLIEVVHNLIKTQRTHMLLLKSFVSDCFILNANTNNKKVMNKTKLLLN